jgi:hypothetical protein
MISALQCAAALSLAFVMCAGGEAARHAMSLLFMVAVPLSYRYERRGLWRLLETNAASVLQKRSAPEADHSTSPPVAPAPHLSASDR